VATAVGTVDLSRYMATGFGGPNPIVQGVLLIVLIFFGLRLLFRCCWRIVVLAVLLPVGMAACALYAIPGTRWLFSWWGRTWGGLLLAQIPSVLALNIGVQLFAHGSGLMAFMFSIAAMQVACDVYTILPFGHLGHEGSPLGAAAAGLRTASVLGSLGARSGATAARAALPANELATRADMYGY
jgi:hypothetical protein